MSQPTGEYYVPITIPDLFEGARYRLVDNVNWLSSADGHWQAGMAWEANCTDVSVTMMTCVSGVSADPRPPKTETYDRIFRGAKPFTVYGEVDCTPDVEWWEVGTQRALQALTDSGPTQVERTLWTGAGGTGGVTVLPNLTTIGPIRDTTGRILLQPSATVVSGVTALDIVEALGRLEELFSECYDGVGWVHTPVKLVSSLAAHGLCYREGSKLYTYRGNLVVVGNGYDADFGPNGAVAPAGTAWLTMTSPVFGYRAAPKTFQKTDSFDRSVNTYKAIAEQTHILGWHCCLISVLASTGGVAAGTVGS